ncbi:antitoxin VbhA family protein [Paenibacillus sp. FSL W7-1287]|uniref:antitoxin VbhA family protein n=1 Tax=Paenibacillus sp. FSL W7-1287 TaxID=2954538 RepID=UPI0030FABD2C
MNISIVSPNKKRVLLVKRYTREQRKRALLNAKASLAIEGMYLTTEEEQLVEQKAAGKMSNAEFIAKAIELAKNV